MQVKMLIGMGNHEFNYVPGDIHTCDDAEGIRLIAVGAAVPYDGKTTEKAVKKAPEETR